MLFGYMRVSKADGSQTTILQKDALLKAGILPDQIYEDMASGKKEDRPQLLACLKALRSGDTLVVWKLDRLGRDLRHLINTVHELTQRGIGFKVLTGHSSTIDTTTPDGKLTFSIFAALAEFERDLIIERTKAGIVAARERGRMGGRPFKMTIGNLKIAVSQLKDPKTNIRELCKTLQITPPTLYRYVSPDGTLREEGQKLIAAKSK